MYIYDIYMIYIYLCIFRSIFIILPINFNVYRVYMHTMLDAQVLYHDIALLLGTTQLCPVRKLDRKKIVIFCKFR